MYKTIKELKKQLAGLPKEEKLNIIEQELVNRAFANMGKPIESQKEKIEISQSSNDESQLSERKKEKPDSLPSNNELETLRSDIKDNVEAYESKTKRKELIPFMYDRSLNWYFNIKNIPAQQKLVAPTYEFFEEGQGKEMFSAIDFLNLLYKQYEELLVNKDKPFDVLDNLKALPVTNRERHSLFGFLLKWFGGYPVANLDEQCDVVLNLIQKEFLSYPEHTPEKELCSVNFETQKAFSELAAHLHAEENGIKAITPNEPQIYPKYNFPESHYINKVHFDFEDLPSYVIQRGIIWHFESKSFRKDSEYYDWKMKLTNFLNSIPEEYRLKTLLKGIEYGRKVYKYHLDNECTNPSNCPLNQSWERRLSLAKDLIKDYQTKELNQIMKSNNSADKIYHNIGFLIHGHDQVKKHEIARFIEKNLGRQITILHEQPNKGRTIIEKFEDHSDVDFAVALWTADDVGNAKNHTALNSRARQNVVFETGFFIGKLGRKNVVVLYEEGVEMPSDYVGVIFISLKDNWKDDLRKEIDAIYSK